MKIRVKFTKEEPVKYLGHLDILRFFQKCFVRAGVRMLYSEGFNPHQKMSFALPLTVGITSRAEYLDADIQDGQDLEKIRHSLNEASGTGFEILEIRTVREDAQSLMGAVRFASYEVFPLDESFYISPHFMEQNEIIVPKKTKKGSRDVDIKPLVCSLSYGRALDLVLCAGSENNLKPELLLEAACLFGGAEYKRENFKIERTGLYGPQMTDLINYQTIAL